MPACHHNDAAQFHDDDGERDNDADDNGDDDTSIGERERDRRQRMVERSHRGQQNRNRVGRGWARCWEWLGSLRWASRSSSRNAAAAVVVRPPPPLPPPNCRRRHPSSSIISVFPQEDAASVASLALVDETAASTSGVGGPESIYAAVVRKPETVASGDSFTVVNKPRKSRMGASIRAISASARRFATPRPPPIRRRRTRQRPRRRRRRLNRRPSPRATPPVGRKAPSWPPKSASFREWWASRWGRRFRRSSFSAAAAASSARLPTPTPASSVLSIYAPEDATSIASLAVVDETAPSTSGAGGPESFFVEGPQQPEVVATGQSVTVVEVHPPSRNIAAAARAQAQDHEEETFENEFIILKGRPCKVVEMSTSKTGKHGHAKVHIVGLDIFTSKKYEDICPSTHNMEAPVVKRKDYQLMSINEDGFVSLLNLDTCDEKEDLKLPEGELAQQIRDAFEKDSFLSR